MSTQACQINLSMKLAWEPRKNYINDFEMHFLSENCPSVDIQLINLFLLMYADDTVIISETCDGLQNMLNAYLLIQENGI